MNRRMMGSVLSIAAFALAAGRTTEAQELQEKITAAKQSAALNQKALRAYNWLEKTEISLKGEVKGTIVKSCAYGPDGQVQKTVVVQPPPKEQGRGLKGRIVANKTAEMKEEMESAAALVHLYVPPSPDKMQVVQNAGKISIAQAGPTGAALTFADYQKAGDALTLTFDRAVKALRQISVNTWLEKPSEKVTLQITMQSLSDGTDYPGLIVLAIPESKIEVKITNSNYLKPAK